MFNMLQINICFLFLIAGERDQSDEEDDHEFKDISRVMLKICQNIQGVTVMQYAHT
jgi:hypothetical protein